MKKMNKTEQLEILNAILEKINKLNSQAKHRFYLEKNSRGLCDVKHICMIPREMKGTGTWHVFSHSVMEGSLQDHAANLQDGTFDLLIDRAIFEANA